MTKLPLKVYCVIDKKTGERISQFYSRQGDAVNKSKSCGYCSEHCEAVKQEQAIEDYKSSN